MKIPVSWLKRYVSVSAPPANLAHRLTMAGVEVHGIDMIGDEWDPNKITVGQITKTDRHPNADRLTLPTIDLGQNETITVVCGAPNLKPGQKIAFAKEGASLFNAKTKRLEILKKATIRGIESKGMVCSPLELGLGEDHDGIMVLNDDAPVGTSLVDYLGDTILDIDVTPNRPDCLSVLGIAREVAATTGQTVTEPNAVYSENGPAIENELRIEIANPEFCSRYTASLISGVEIGPSPRWMQEILRKVGQRPINNIVDITNYVMLEYGQPLHAFDFDQISGNSIFVKTVEQGEIFNTLDGETRSLDPPILAIADSKGTIGLAGVMGGSSTEINSKTTTVLLESANFDAINTRRTGSKLRLHTEASHRFERGIRAEMAPLALRRATQLILENAGGEAADGIIDVYPGFQNRQPLRVSSSRINQLLGTDYDMRRVEQILESLGFTNSMNIEPDIDLHVEIPYWRSDITIEDDLVEEIARIGGYENIPTTPLSTAIPHQEPQPKLIVREQIRDLLVSAGMQEIISYNLTNLATLKSVEGSNDPVSPLKIANPMNSEQEYLRTTLRGAMLETLANNRRVNATNSVRIFELGRVFLPRERDLPEEKEMLAGILTGPRFPTHWQISSDNMGFFDAKGVLEKIFNSISLQIAYQQANDLFLHPGKTAQITFKDTAVGIVGELHPRVLKKFNLGGIPVAFFEIDLELLISNMLGTNPAFKSISRFPQSKRDVALIVDQHVSSVHIQEIIESHEFVMDSAPFDIYTGTEIPQGKKSITYSITFQSSIGTLTSEQVDKAQHEILQLLASRVKAVLRY